MQDNINTLIDPSGNETGLKDNVIIPLIPPQNPVMKKVRLVCLDVLRGMTMMGMILINS